MGKAYCKDCVHYFEWQYQSGFREHKCRAYSKEKHTYLEKIIEYANCWNKNWHNRCRKFVKKNILRVGENE
jgi:hypothetical protein